MILQALFFTSDSISYAEGFLYMGLTALGASLIAFTIRWPMWGGMLPWACRKPAPGDCTEEAYFSRDYTEGERRLGTHGSALRFVSRLAAAGAGAVPGRGLVGRCRRRRRCSNHRRTSSLPPPHPRPLYRAGGRVPLAAAKQHGHPVQWRCCQQQGGGRGRGSAA